MSAQALIRDGLVAALPNLRAFAISLARDVTLADDLVQETILKAWNAADRFEPGSNLDAWLFTILRNNYFSLRRKRAPEVEDVDGAFSARLSSAPDHHARLDLEDMREALGRLPPAQREAVLLVGASGFSYDEAARIMGVAVGTVKSRVNRARSSLARMLAVNDPQDLGTDPLTRAALQAA